MYSGFKIILILLFSEYFLGIFFHFETNENTIFICVPSIYKTLELGINIEQFNKTYVVRFVLIIIFVFTCLKVNAQSGRGYISFAKRTSKIIGNYGTFNLKGDFSKKLIWNFDSIHTSIVISNCPDMVQQEMDSLESGNRFDECLKKKRFAIRLVFNSDNADLTKKGYIDLTRNYKNLQYKLELIYRSSEGEIIREKLKIKSGAVRFTSKRDNTISIRCSVMLYNFYDLSFSTMARID